MIIKRRFLDAPTCAKGCFVKKFALVLATIFAAAPAFAQEAAPAVHASAANALGMMAIGIGIMMGLAALGGTLGQGKAAASALDGVARNPAASGKITGPLILSLAFMESLVLFVFLISFLLQGALTTVLTNLTK
jgi:F-type H+-transporting ATPase subunit c